MPKCARGLSVSQISFDPTAIRAEDAAELAAEVAGPVLLPGDAGYAEETATYNLARPIEPALVVCATGVADVRAAVRFAAERGMPVAIKATGHQIVLAERGAVLINTRRMNRVTIDAERRTARVEAGVIWRQVIDEAARYGLAAASGSAPHVGVVGYHLGGGLSPIAGRSRGYASDGILSMELVTADGTVRQVTPEREPDLFWALRGGKGNFGVVTALEFELFPMSRLFGGGLYFPGERLAEVLDGWRDWVPGLPEEMTSSLGVQRLPALPDLPEPLQGAFVLHLRVAYLGAADEGERLLAPMLAAAPVVFGAVAEMPSTAVGMVHMDPPDPLPYYDRTVSLRALPAQAAAALVEVLGPESDSPLVNFEIRSLGGALDREPSVPDAVPTRGIPFVAFGFGVGGPDQADFMRGHLAKVVGALEPWSDEHLMPNFLSSDEATTPRTMADVYGAERFQRLTAVKRVYDPTNAFRFNHNVPAK
jgi:FAD/FMN-containing dehydrogenase